MKQGNHRFYCVLANSVGVSHKVSSNVDIRNMGSVSWAG